jgi:hypothetical protein
MLLNTPFFRDKLFRMREVDDYTDAFLVSAGVLVFMALFAIWAFWGLIVAGLVSWGADRLITVDLRRKS